MSEEDDVTKVKVVFVGEAFTGKTAIIQRVIYDTYEDNMVTTMVASNYSKVIDFEGNHSIRFEIWDTAGQEKYRSILLWCMIYQIEEHLKKLKIIG